MAKVDLGKYEDIWKAGKMCKSANSDGNEVSLCTRQETDLRDFCG